MYDFVNEVLGEIFLDSQNQGRPIYLALSARGRSALAERLRCNPQKAEEYACGIIGNSLAKVGNPYAFHNEVLARWRPEEERRPPFIGLLYALVHAAELMVADGTTSSSNYYQRLAGLTHVDRGHLSQFGSETQKYWAALSRWLTDKNYLFGVPTARSLNANLYVSLALSQAVIREADRRSFHQLFERYGFSGTDVLGPDEIAQYIDAWMATGRPSRILRNAWSNPGLRPRICEVALAELADWVGGQVEAAQDGGGIRRLSLAAAIATRFPKRMIRFSVGLEDALEKEILIRAPDGRTGTIANTAYGNFATLNSGVADDVAALLSRGVDLEASAQKGRLVWKPRFVIPLKRSDHGPYWTEVTRVTLGGEYLVLVRGDARFKNAVEHLLQTCARPGYTVANPDVLPGLPPGWLLYEKVLMTGVKSGEKEDLAPLVPMSESGTLQFIGGLRLGRNVWHRNAGVHLRFFGAEEVRIFATEDSSNALLADSGLQSGTAELAIDKQQWPASGNVKLHTAVSLREPTTSTILVRCANTPLPLDRSGTKLLAYREVFSASPIGLDQGTEDVRGLVASGSAGSLTDRIVVPDGELPHHVGGEAEDFAPSFDSKCNETSVSTAPLVPRIRSVISQVTLPCVERGCHRWRIPTFDHNTPRSITVDARCEDCGITILMRRGWGADARATSEMVREPVPTSSEHPVPRHRPLRYDLLLDAICYLGTGGWATLETLLAGRLDEPWAIHAIARDLSFLGHLDVALQPGSNRLRNWSVAPAAISYVGDVGFLAGFRSRAFLTELSRRIHRAGGTLVREKLDDHPSVLKIKGIQCARARDAVAGLKTPHGNNVQVFEGAAKSIASVVKKANPASALHQCAIGKSNDIKMYDLSAGRWTRADNFDRAGAYKITDFGTSYIYKSPSGSAFQGPHEIVKLFAARDAGVKLHWYDAATLTFSARLGCEPPGLLGRALTASAGRLPKVSNGVSVFEQVTPEVATAILNFMYR